MASVKSRMEIEAIIGGPRERKVYDEAHGYEIDAIITASREFRATVAPTQAMSRERGPAHRSLTWRRSGQGRRASARQGRPELPALRPAELRGPLPSLPRRPGRLRARTGPALRDDPAGAGAGGGELDAAGERRGSGGAGPLGKPRIGREVVKRGEELR